MENQFERTELLLGKDAIQKLKNAHVAVFGVGGVGGFVVEALVRSGVGEIDVIDKDTVSLSNINRQIIALHSTVGQPKVEVIKNRALDINPNVKINAFETFFLPDTADMFDFSKYDYVVDAIDTVKGKIDQFRNPVKSQKKQHQKWNAPEKGNVNGYQTIRHRNSIHFQQRQEKSQHQACRHRKDRQEKGQRQGFDHISCCIKNKRPAEIHCTLSFLICFSRRLKIN